MPPANKRLARYVRDAMARWDEATKEEYERLWPFWSSVMRGQFPSKTETECDGEAKFFIASALQHEKECGGSEQLDELRELAVEYPRMKRKIMEAEKMERKKKEWRTAPSRKEARV